MQVCSKPSRRPVCRLPRCRRRFEQLPEILSGLRDTGRGDPEILHDTPPRPPESDYLLSSPGKPISAEGFARMVTFTTNSVLWCITALKALPSNLYLVPGEAYGSCAIGAIPILQVRRLTGKIPRLGVVPFCISEDRPRLRMSIAAKTGKMQARRKEATAQRPAG
jgi:hypothetical protein